MSADRGKLIKLGANVEIQAGFGRAVNIADQEHKKNGAKVSNDYKASFSKAQIVLRINAPNNEDIQNLREPASTLKITWKSTK
jgi:NAD/NADP transhydrogenase alpha subunit